MDTFLKALEEVYAVEPADRFMETGSIWQAIVLDLCRDLEVDPADMKYVAYLVEKKVLHPIREKDSYQYCTHSLQGTTRRRTPGPTELSTRSSNKL